MKRVLIPALILAIAGAALYYSERHKQETRVGPEAVLNALADTQRGISRVPAALTRLSKPDQCFCFARRPCLHRQGTHLTDGQ